ncbi:NAD(P)H dehydrogenase [Lentilactobacillus fungorum]|uniref:NAD(P)H dehydrogenase n=1 Tax=Lentilactobacillus fungorum TaxID=2201250 RepID=A0ABQ3VZ39_9LACO|nr:NAD(P)H-dependent oxidoreductase [Lentilactobacillus fungorum]GHP13604.1 NAD(P)H dehydrogenase [Lentilactobacillus fungorum]
MKTLILISHPKLADSATQEFLKTAGKSQTNVAFEYIDDLYKGTKIDIVQEQQRLIKYNRMVFQFPLYWYSSPASLKQYMDDVFTRKFVVANHLLRNKELGIVVTLGDAEAEFQAGGSEHFTISELLRPFEAFANKAGMTYLKPFVVSQFGYLEEEQKELLLVDYLQYVSAQMPLSLDNREKWLVDQLTHMKQEKSEDDQQKLDLIIGSIEARQDQLDDLKTNVKMIRDQEE